MKNKKTFVFSSPEPKAHKVSFSLQSYGPISTFFFFFVFDFAIISLWDLVSKMSREPLELWS